MMMMMMMMDDDDDDDTFSPTSCHLLSFQSKYTPQHTVLKFSHYLFCHLKHCHKESSSEKQTTCKILTAATETDIQGLDKK